MYVSGMLSKMQSDRGEQLLTAASKQLEALDFIGVLRWAGRKGIKWHLVPTEGSTSRVRTCDDRNTHETTAEEL
jgi:hypothetical protein